MHVSGNFKSKSCLMAVGFEQQRVIQFDVKRWKTLEHQLFLTYDYGLVLRRKKMHEWKPLKAFFVTWHVTTKL